jgi:Tol biopolymer transport system component
MVWQGSDMDDSGEISPDGKYLSFVDWDTGDLAIREMSTGKKRKLTDKGSWEESGESADASVWSPDSKQLAYAWYNGMKEPFFCDLRLIGVDASKPKVLYKGDYFKDWVSPHDWSPDGKHILSWTWKTIEAVELMLVNVEDGTIQKLKSLNGIDPYPLSAQFSANGKFVVYEHPQAPKLRKNDISILSIDGKFDNPLINHPSDDRLLGWTPDMQHILFVSDRTGTWDVWTIRTSNGRPVGDPHLVRRNIGSVRPMGLTNNGSLFYSTPGFLFDIFSATIDPETGTISKKPEKLFLPYEGHNTRPDLSPDGQKLAYISLRGPANRSSVLCIYNLESGEVREVQPNTTFRRFGYPRWTSSGESILLLAHHTELGKGLFSVNVETGITDLLLSQDETFGDYYNGWSPVTSLDGKSIFFIQGTRNIDCRIMRRDYEGGKEVELYQMPAYANNIIALSPDGEKLAVMMREREDVRVLKILPIEGGESLEIHRFEQRGRAIIDIDWSPDGAYIYFEKDKQGSDEGETQLWRIPSMGGEAQNLGLTMHRFMHINIHPDGKQISFGSYTMDEKAGAIWKMENFLPAGTMQN